MLIDIDINRDKYSKKYSKYNNKKLGVTRALKIIFLIVFIIIFICYILVFITMKKISNIFKKIKIFENLLKNKGIISQDFISENVEGIEFDEKIKKKYIENQLHFCHSNDLFLNTEIENKIQNVKAQLNDISFNMYVYKDNDVVSKLIRTAGNWEATSTNDIIKCLDYYSKKRNKIKMK